MQFNKLTFQISLVVLAITALYTLVYSGLAGLLMSSAVALIAAAFLDPFELVVGVTVIFAILFTTVGKRLIRSLEMFQNPDGAKEIVGRVGGMEKKYHPVQHQLHNPRMEPAGVYDPMFEGFEDIQPTKPKEGESSKSAAASTAATATNQVGSDMVKAIANTAAGAATGAATGNTAGTAAAVTGAAAKSTSAFTGSVSDTEFESATGGLFKLGKMPSEHTDGPKLDAGKTIMKAMSSFDPKTISSMTEDTKKLLETQKGLMSMLNQMRPVLADGKELLNTFSGMFSSQGSGSPFKL
jgi:hypothetical protein